MPIRAVVFDLDGVLIDTEGLQYQAWSIALAPLGVTLSRDDYLHMAGRQGDLIAQELVESLGLATEATALLRHKSVELDRLLDAAPIRLLPGAVEAVADLGRSMPLALATGGSESETRLKVDRVGLARHFKVVVTRSDVRRGKPHPDVLCPGRPAACGSPTGLRCHRGYGVRCGRRQGRGDAVRGGAG
jgi:beta-phosphoglucomutase-like phosphatase (HAD superfamily)